MAAEMTSRERLKAVFEHRVPDRVPMRETPWASTVARWRREGLAAGVSVDRHFGLDRIFSIKVDNSPRYPVRTIEQTDEYVIHTTPWGATQKDWKTHGGVPEFLDFTIKDRESWAAAKARMTPADDRIDWEALARDYPAAQADGAFVFCRLRFGYDLTSSFVVGAERMLMAMATDPDWCHDIFMHELNVNLALMDRLWERGYTFDAIYFCEDLGYRNGLLFSPAVYKAVCQPVHAKAVAWCRAHGGVKVFMHSCGDVSRLVGELVGEGIDGLEPLEQKAGMDALAIKRDFGDRLALMGGVDVRAWAEGGEALERETVGKIEALKAGGGYIFHSDHSVPDNVSFANYTRVIELAREHGRYD